MRLRTHLRCALAIAIFALSLHIVSADVPATSSAAAVSATPPIPDAASLKTATKLVDDVYSSDVANAKSPTQKLALAQKMLDATKEEKDAAALFVLFSKTLTLACEAGDLPSAFAIVDRLDESYRVDTVKLKADSATFVVKSTTLPEQFAIQIPLINAVIDASLASDRYEIARPMSLLLAEASRGTKDPALQMAADACLKKIRETQQAFDENKLAIAVLANKPSDPDANLKVGIFRCIYKNDWNNGLPCLALSSDDALKAAAKLESEGVATTDDQIKLADMWWLLSEKAAGYTKNQLQTHAAQWYQSALPNLSGLAKSRVEKRLAVISTSTSERSSPPSLNEQKFVSILDKLVTVGNAPPKKNDEGVVLVSKNPREIQLSSEKEFKAPLTIVMVAKTDSINLRLLFGDKGRVTFNWEGDQQELYHADPISGKKTPLPGKGAIPKNTFVTIRWILDAKESRVQVDGVDRCTFFGDYSSVAGKIAVNTNNATLTIKSLEVASETTKGDVASKSSPLLFIPRAQIAAAPKTITPPDKAPTKQPETPNNPPPAPIAKNPNDLQIVEAKWGAGGRQLDVTAKLQQLVKGSSLRFTVSNDLLTDPAQNQHKALVIVYLVAGEKVSASYIEGDDVELSSTPNSFDPKVIERPEFAKAAKPIIKNVTSINSMIVRVSEDGDTLGLTTDIIASVPPDTRKSRDAGASLTTRKIGEDMRTSFDEAVRAVKLRYPTWTGGRIDVSFGEKYTEHDGGSAAAAFSLLLLSSLEGFEIDPKFAVTGDITVDWKIRKVGGVSSKIRGAIVDKFQYVAIPAANDEIMGDLPLLYGDNSLWDVQILSIATLQQAVATVRQDRSPELTEALKLFASLQPTFIKSGRLALRNAETVQTLKRIVELAPNHLSAKALLAIADNTAPKTLSSAASLYRLSIIMYPYRNFITSREVISRKTLPASMTANARKQIAQLRPIASKEIQPLVADLSGLIEVSEDAASRKSTTGSTAFDKSRDNFISRLSTISANRELLEKLVRQGY